MTIETKYNIGDDVWYIHPLGRFIKTGIVTGFTYEIMDNATVLMYVLNHEFGDRMPENYICPDIAELKKNYDAEKEARWMEMTKEVQRVIDKRNEFLEVARSINENVQAEAAK